MLEEGGDGKITYKGGLRKCMLVNEGMEAKEVRTLENEVVASDLWEHKVRYSLKYDRQILMTVKGDMNVRMIFKENDEHEYLCVGGNNDPMRRLRKGIEAHEGRAHTSDNGVVCDTSERDGVVVVQKDWKGGVKQGGVERCILYKNV